MQAWHWWEPEYRSQTRNRSDSYALPCLLVSLAMAGINLPFESKTRTRRREYSTATSNADGSPQGDTIAYLGRPRYLPCSLGHSPMPMQRGASLKSRGGRTAPDTRPMRARRSTDNRMRASAPPARPLSLRTADTSPADVAIPSPTPRVSLQVRFFSSR